ncbi:MAG: hypothetical protein SGJ27_12860 [Candidatus Melainabacteria bacterium]|nr:hypothetical protein [Candidatus Melainabacteria bacterium]
MSRSYKKSPVVSPSSSKQFNSKANRRQRHKVRVLLQTSVDLAFLVLPVKREISNLYDSPKDGRCNLFGTPSHGEEGAELKKLMRK